MKWAIELGEHDIQYRPRTAIKGQVLADFMLESAEPVNPDVEQLSISEGDWQLYVDGSSHSGGSGAGVLLTSPDGKDYPYVLHFNFRTTNNEAEYEALITGLRLAKDLDVQDLEVYSDSQIVVQQVKGEYETMEQSLQRYLEVVKPMLQGF